MEKSSVPASDSSASSPLPKGAVPILAVILAGLLTAGAVYVNRENRRERDLLAKNQTLTTNIDQLQSQIAALNDKLAAQEKLAAQKTAEETVTVPPAIEVTKPVAPPATARAQRKAAPKTRSPQPAVHDNRNDQRLKEIESRLNKQQDDINGTKNDVEKTRTDLEGRLASTRDDLNGSIARTHEEIVELQKRGERNYYEFDLAKDKDFRRVGPIGLSLRKANTKRKTYDMTLMVDDQQLQKKSVNLYEPLAIANSDQGQSVNLVVTEITKDRVKGYVSEPKYRQTASVSSASAPAAPTQAPTGLQRR